MIRRYYEEAFKPACPRWIDTIGLTDSALARQINALGDDEADASFHQGDVGLDERCIKRSNCIYDLLKIADDLRRGRFTYEICEGRYESEARYMRQ